MERIKRLRLPGVKKAIIAIVQESPNKTTKEIRDIFRERMNIAPESKYPSKRLIQKVISEAPVFNPLESLNYLGQQIKQAERLLTGSVKQIIVKDKEGNTAILIKEEK